jgi:hypothetical protein
MHTEIPTRSLHDESPFGASPSARMALPRTAGPESARTGLVCQRASHMSRPLPNGGHMPSSSYMYDVAVVGWRGRHACRGRQPSARPGKCSCRAVLKSGTPRETRNVSVIRVNREQRQDRCGIPEGDCSGGPGRRRSVRRHRRRRQALGTRSAMDIRSLGRL